MRILYVAAGRSDRRLIKALSELNHRVEVAEESGDAVAMADLEAYGAVILDAQAPLPERVAAFAAASPDAFLILVVATGSSEARAAALRAGADACFTRPVHIGEVGGKLDALAKRFGSKRSGAKRLGATQSGASASLTDVELLPRQQSARVAGELVALSRREYLLLEILARRPGEVVSTQMLLEAVWGGEGDHDPAVVRTCMAKLRRKIESRLGRRLIHAERGLGYSLQTGGRT